MHLSFTKKFPWNEDTNFESKIIASFTNKAKPKIHSIREDKPNRWRAPFPREIHFCFGVRTKHYRCFYKANCTGVQKIAIYHNFRGLTKRIMQVYVDGRLLSDEEVEELAIADGFNSTLHFNRWFKDDFTGKIIHWTNKRY